MVWSTHRFVNMQGKWRVLGVFRHSDRIVDYEKATI